jgi:superfamily II DNA or RNA helicase
VLLEGWDLPQLGCIVLARPTKSLALYGQSVGRGLRPAPGKDHLLVIDHAGAVFEHGLIEEPIEWGLSPDSRAARASQGGGSSQRSRVLTACPECHAVRWQGQPCGACGWRPRPRPVAVDVAEGDLAQVDRDRRIIAEQHTAERKRHFYQQLTWIARQRGYKSGWAAHKFKEKFGDWPPRWFAAEPIEPDDATLAWVRSRVIAYAKALAKHQGAA